MEVFRITHIKRSGTLTASGFPARWNSEGVYVIYTAGSRALACLENVVHRGSSDLRAPFITMVISIPDVLFIKELLIADLPVGWNKTGEEGYHICRSFGDKWVSIMESVLLKVPSAIIPNESYYLINPGHPDFQKIQGISEEPFLFDDRIKK